MKVTVDQVNFSRHFVLLRVSVVKKIHQEFVHCDPLEKVNLMQQADLILELTVLRCFTHQVFAKELLRGLFEYLLDRKQY